MIRLFCSLLLGAQVAACAVVSDQVDAATGTTKIQRCEVYRGELAKWTTLLEITGNLDEDGRARMLTLGALIEVFCADDVSAQERDET